MLWSSKSLQNFHMMCRIVTDVDIMLNEEKLLSENQSSNAFNNKAIIT